MPKRSKKGISMILGRFPMGLPKRSKKGTKGGFEGTAASTWSTGGDKRVKSRYKRGFSKNKEHTKGGGRRRRPPPFVWAAEGRLRFPKKSLGVHLGDPFGTLGLGPVPQKRLGGPFFDPCVKAIPERVQNRPRTLETGFWSLLLFYRV